MIDLLSAILIGVILETLFFGIFLVLAYITLVLLSARYGIIRNWMIAVTLIHGLANTVHWVVSVMRIMRGFINTSSHLAALVYFGRASDPLFLISSASFVFSGFVALSFMIFRTYIIWDKNIYVCILPILVTILLVVTGAIFVAKAASIDLLVNIYSPKIQPWILSALCSGCFVNVYTTALIAYRILRNDSRYIEAADQHRAIGILRAVRILTDSAAICLIVTVSLFISYLLESNFDLIAMSVEPPVIGIAYCLVIVRVNGKVEKPSGTHSEKPTTSLSRGTIIFRNSPSRPQFNIPPSPSGSIPMNVIITKDTTDYDTEDDGDSYHQRILAEKPPTPRLEIP